MGKFYRSKHELIFVFKAGTAPHTNNFGMGGKGRYRTNVWDYPGVIGSEGREQLRNHPTVKPVAMVRDAIKDCSQIGDIILDPFGGSGTTLIAAEQCRRKARLIELDPVYCDVIVQRHLSMFGGDAVDQRGGIFASRASQGLIKDLEGVR
jgi:DNA modification methylase